LTEFGEGTNLHLPAPQIILEGPDGVWMLESEERNADPPVSWRTLVLLTAFWIGVGLFGGTAEYLGVRSAPNAPSWVQVVVLPLLMGVLWIPLTLAIGWGSWKFPPASLHPQFSISPMRAILHGLASLGVSFGLNAAFFGILLIVGSIPTAEFGALVRDTALRLIHINAGVYWVILGMAQLPAILSSRANALRRAEDQDAFEETLTVRSGNQSIVVRVSDIRWIEGAGDYVRLHLSIANHLHSERLKRLETRLDPDRFVRVHRSAIVNVAAVRRLRHLGHGDYEAVLEGGSTVRVSRTRRSQLTEVLEKREVGEGEV
jgi:hypothetical protein